VSYSRNRTDADRFSDYVWAQALRRHGRRCYVCGATGVPLRRDHIIPVSEGGTNDLANCGPICDPCHKPKSERERIRAYRRKQAKAKRPAEPHPSEGLKPS
jgi:5-methylcytosine-specific restriction endonuclease McrA